MSIYNLMQLFQVEPTRRSARLKSIQVKQALKDDFISDDDDSQGSVERSSPFQRKVRSKEAPLSKGPPKLLLKEIALRSLHY
jgi:hypothetical protein